MSRRTLTLLVAFVSAALLTTLPATPATALTGGPDGAGYSFIDSTEPGGPAGGPFASIAPVSGGSGVDIGNHCTDCTTSYELPFPLRFHDRTASIVRVGASGFVEIPDAPGPPSIDLFRSSLRTSGRGGNGVFAQTTGDPGRRTLVLEWRGVVPKQPTVREQFQLVLHEDSDQIEMRYLDVNAESPGEIPPGFAAIYGGVGNRSLPYPDLLRDGLAVRFTRQVEGDPTRVTLATKPLAAVYGDPVTLTATVAALEPGGARLTGTVTFYDKDRVLGSAPVNGRGVSRLRLGTPIPEYDGEDFVARYDGDAAHRLTYSDTVHYVIEPASTTITIDPPPDGTVRRGGPGLTARVALAAPSRITVTGSVVWFVDDTYLTETRIARGRATLPPSVLPLGDHVVRASLITEVFYIDSSESDPVPVTVVGSGS